MAIIDLNSIRNQELQAIIGDQIRFDRQKQEQNTNGMLAGMASFGADLEASEQRNKQKQSAMAYESAIKASTNEDGSLNEDKFLYNISQTAPSLYSNAKALIEKNNIDKMKAEAESFKNKELGLKYKSEALTAYYTKQKEAFDVDSKNHDLVLTMIKNAENNDDKNRAIAEAEKRGVSISGYYKNNEFSEDMKEKAIADLMSAKDLSASEFAKEQQAYNESKDTIANMFSMLNEKRENYKAMQEDRRIDNAEKTTAYNISKDSKEALSNAKNGVFNDTNAVNEFNNANIEKIRTVKNELSDKEKEARMIVTKSNQYKKQAEVFQSNLNSYMVSNGYKDSDGIGVISRMINEKYTVNSEDAKMIRGIEHLGTVAFFSGLEEMRGFGALSNMEGMRIENVKGTVNKNATFGELKTTVSNIITVYGDIIDGASDYIIDARRNSDEAIAQYENANNIARQSFNSKYKSNLQQPQQQEQQTNQNMGGMSLQQ